MGGKGMLLMLLTILSLARTKKVAILSETHVISSPINDMVDAAKPLLVEKYPQDEFDVVPVASNDCVSWVKDGSAEQYDIVIAFGFQWSNCFDLHREHTNTWFALLDDEGPQNKTQNFVSVEFDEAQVAYAAGYLAGLATTSKVVAAVCGIPLKPVKKFCNGFQYGVIAACPDCRFEGRYINSFFHPSNAHSVADSLLSAGADVIFGAGGGTGSEAIKHFAGKGGLAIGVDADEYTTTFANSAADVRARVLSSAQKRVTTAVLYAIDNLLPYESGAKVPAFSGGSNKLLVDYSNGGVKLADCHTSCARIGAQKMDAVKKVENQLAADMLKVDLNAEGNVRTQPEGAVENTFYVAPNPSQAPKARQQHAMTSFSSPWHSSLFLFGGRDDSSTILDDYWIYDIYSGMWIPGDHGMTSGAAPPALTKSCLVSLGAGVTLFGGSKGTEQSGDVYVFSDQPPFLGFADSTSPDIRYTWSSVPANGDGPEVEGPGCTAFNSTCFLVFGGRKQFSESAELYMACLELPSVKWTKLWPPASGDVGPGPDARELPGLAVVEDSMGLHPDGGSVLVVVGGTNAGIGGLNDAWAFSLTSASPSWVELQNLPWSLRSQPLLFTKIATDPATGDESKVLVVQVTEGKPEIGLGAFIFDSENGNWGYQYGGSSHSDILTDFVGAVAVQANGDTWLFGGSKEKDGALEVIGDTFTATFAIQPICGPGSQAEGVKCVECGIGFFSPGGADATCIACAAGSVALTAGSSVCIPCDRGFYEQKGTCTACASGKFTGDLGSTECKQCGTGKYSSSKASECSLCKTGTYAATLGMSECTICQSPSGSTAAWTTMKQVETDNGLEWSLYQGAESKESCGCKSGYQNDTSGECIECRQGLHCGGMDGILILPGFMATARKSSDEGTFEHFEVYQCVPAESCPGGPPGTCSGGRVGLACNECPKGMHAIDGGDCEECGSGPWWRPWWATLVVALCLLLAWTPSTFPLENPGLFTDVTVSGRRFLGALVMCKQALSGMLQTTFIISNFDITLPNSIRTIYSSSGIGMDLNMMSLECTHFDKAVQRTVLMNLLPLVVLLYAAFLCFLGLFLPSRQKFPRWPEVLSSVGSLFAYFFITICNSAMNMGFATMMHPNGKKALRYFPHLLEDDDRYTTIQMVSAAGLLVWSIGGTAVVAFGLYSQPKYARNLNFRKAMVGLSMPYKNDKTWWYIVTLMRSLFVSLSVLCFEQGSAQNAFLTCVFLVYSMMTNAFRPHFAPLSYYVDSAYSVSIVAILVYLQLYQLTGQGAQMLEAITAFSYLFICTTTIYIVGLRMRDRNVRLRIRDGERKTVFGRALLRPDKLDEHMKDAFGRALSYILPDSLDVDMGDLVQTELRQGVSRSIEATTEKDHVADEQDLPTISNSPRKLDTTNVPKDIVSSSMSGPNICAAHGANDREVTISISDKVSYI
jgi:basic membrane lipoprotein Med (substrate-binding protein (PBP1-ABC) superfamily)